MISVLIYGRNDAHGYNLHRRAALSLNCIAEVLTDPDDEVIFVDYNTPAELPTFIEAVSDTLTDHCLDLLRVLRVPAQAHHQRFGARTHLPAIEPVARNVAARRSNPANRWLLSTNTDMIFMPLAGRSMTELLGALPAGYYGLPRFELPEWFWEQLPRSKPDQALSTVSRLGRRLALDEPTVSHDWVRFDAPGDFQLMLRDDLMAIDGFDEDMILGWHVDSNISRRLLLHRGAIHSLEGQLAAYHCNHTRTPTVYHGDSVTNDLDTFFVSLREVALPAQRLTWGLPDVRVEEVRVRHGVGARCPGALTDVIPTGPRVTSDPRSAPYSLAYDSAHVIAHVVDTLVVSPPDVRIGYVGVNPLLRRMLSVVVEHLGFERPLAAATFDDRTAIAQLARDMDVFIIDLGLDLSDADVPPSPESWPPTTGADLELPPAFGWTLRALDDLIDAERRRFERVRHMRPMTLVNSTALFYDEYVRAQMDCSYTTFHSRVRRARVKPADRVDRETLVRVRREERWWLRRIIGKRSLAVPQGVALRLGGLADYGGFRTGWSVPTDYGVWTVGPRSQLTISVGDISEGEHELSLTLVEFCVARGELLRVSLFANGEKVASRDFVYTIGVPWRVRLPAHIWAAGEIELSFAVEEPRSPAELGWSIDPRPLGVHLGTLAVERVGQYLTEGETVVFRERSGAGSLLGEGWSTLEAGGVWTDGERAQLTLRLAESVPSDVELVIDAIPYLTAEHSTLDVEVWARGERRAAQTFQQYVATKPLRVGLTDRLLDADRRLLLELRLREPMSALDLGLSSDPRRLGLHLRALTIGEPPDHLATADVEAERPISPAR